MQPSSDSLPVLIAESGPLKGERWIIRKLITVGRGEDCDIVIADRRISRHHAHFKPGEGGVWLEDLKSKNGTHHNGQDLKDPVLLQDGDMIQVALAQKFTFLSADATVPLDSSALDGSPTQENRLKLEKRSRRVWVMEREIVPPLSAAQFTMLELLYRSGGELVPREQLLREIWGEEAAYDVTDQALDALVRRLRDRIAAHDSSHNYVVTVRGHGLRLDNPKLN